MVGVGIGCVVPITHVVFLDVGSLKDVVAVWNWESCSAFFFQARIFATEATQDGLDSWHDLT